MSIQTHEFKNGFKFVYQKSANRSPTTAINVFCDFYLKIINKNQFYIRKYILCLHIVN